MTAAPLVSIIIPLHDDEEYAAAALDSCLSQTSRDFEVICVDDASTDGTAGLVAGYASRDDRVKLVRQPQNASAFQARRVGIAASTGRYVMFLDGDDELAPDAISVTVQLAEETGADLIGFGVQIVADEEDFPARFQASLQPEFDRLDAPHIVPSLFPPGAPANGHLWRYLYRRQLLEAAYEVLPREATFYRANDLPIAFLAAAHARKYVSTRTKLYRYYFRRGTSGHAIEDMERFEFLLSGLNPLAAAGDGVHRIADASAKPELLRDSYESARTYLVSNLLRSCLAVANPVLQQQCVERLIEEVGAWEVIRAGLAFVPASLRLLTAHGTAASVRRPTPRNVLMTTAHLGTGGLQGVLFEHAASLRDRGYTVTIGVMQTVDNEMTPPDGVSRVLIEGDSLAARVSRWREVCSELQIDAIIDHHILYNETWPWFALAARELGVATYGWLHNFALRPVFDGTTRIGYLTTHANALEAVITLSPTDVVFWKLRGLEHVVWLPNPLSRLAQDSLATPTPRTFEGGPIELVWWGRLDPRTKQVVHLLDVAAELRSRGVEFMLTLIGPDSASLSATAVMKYAESKKVSDRLRLRGDTAPAELRATLEHSHVMVLTSAIEGDPLTLMEAHALGLPVIMYELPWIPSTSDSPAIVTVPQGDRGAIADRITDIVAAPESYAALSEAALTFAQKANAIDVGELVIDLLEGRLSPEYSPAPSIERAQLLLDWTIRFSERNARSMARTRRVLRQGERARRKLRQIEAGASFRIGRLITAVPRAVRRAVQSRTQRRATNA